MSEKSSEKWQQLILDRTSPVSKVSSEKWRSKIKRLPLGPIGQNGNDNTGVTVDDGKTLLTVFERPGLRVRSDAVHQNQKIRPWVLAAIVLFFGAFYIALRAANDMSRGTVGRSSSVFVSPTAVSRPSQTPFDVNALLMATVKVAATHTPMSAATITLTPSPTWTPLPTLTPSHVPTKHSDFKVVLRSYWPKKGWGHAKTALGLSPVDVEDWGLACPDSLPLGSELVFAGLFPGSRRNTFVCVDRAALGNDGGVYAVVLYSKRLSSGLFDAWLVYRP